MKKEKIIRKNDMLFATAMLIIAVVVYLFVQFIYGKEGVYVQVTVNGEVYGEYSLNQDIRMCIDDGQTDGFNVFVIKDGKVSVTEADCPDKLCVKQRAISKNGESIVCLPHKLVISVIGGEEAEYDGFTG
ncbi:MAG: NusG domain II-containing protein [Lachnospiraceae bacterium]|nr:NusG domain II-containing protein [Lachnospiraceae bacterium]